MAGPGPLRSRSPYDRLEWAEYESFWKRAAKLPDEWFPMTTHDAYYLTAAEALGIVDEVVEIAPRRPGDIGN